MSEPTTTTTEQHGSIVVVIPVGHTYWREYHVRAELTEKRIDCSHAFDAGEVTKLLSRVRGVEHVVVERYKLTVFRALAWSWDDVQPEILRLLAMMEAS